jgi:hypothetical protein
VDTFFLNKDQAARYGWTARLEEMMFQKVLRAREVVVDASGRSSSRTDAASSASHYSTGSSSSAFEANSGLTESSEFVLATPPVPAVDLMKIRKVSSGLELPSRIAAALSF